VIHHTKNKTTAPAGSRPSHGKNKQDKKDIYLAVPNQLTTTNIKKYIVRLSNMNSTNNLEILAETDVLVIGAGIP
jgi:hypothetical protein